MRPQRPRSRRSGQRPGYEPGQGGGSTGCPRRQLLRDEPAWASGASGRREGRALGGVLQEPLQERVLVLQRLDAARQIVDLGLEQFNLLGEIGQTRWSLLRSFQSTGQSPPDRRIHDDAQDRDEERNQQNQSDDRHYSSL